MLAEKDELDKEELELRMRFEREINVMYAADLDTVRNLKEAKDLLAEYKS